MATTLSFISPGGTSHTVTIDKGNDTLIGTPEPFIIEEDDDPDMFKPIRETTGYINFIDDGTKWESLLPANATDIQVRCGSFFGFVIPQTYGGRFLYGPSEFSLAIGCPLRALASYKLSYNMISGATITFNALLEKLVSSFPSSASVSILVSNNYYVSTYLTLKVQWALLFEMDDESGGFVPKYNNLEILENICKFFGFTAHSVGSTIRLTAMDNNPATYIPVASFLLADTNSTVELIQGVGLVKIKAKVSGENPFEFAFDQILDENLQITPLYTYGRLYHGNGYVAYYLTTVETPTLAGVTLPTSYSFHDFDFNVYGGFFYHLSVVSTDHEDYDPYNKSWSSVMRFEKLSDPSTYTMDDLSDSAVFTLNRRVFVCGGYVQIKGRAFFFANDVNDYEETSPDCTIVAMFRIGDMYFNGVTFEQYNGSGEIPHFTIYSKNGVLGKREWQPAYWSQISYLTDGYDIPITESMEGEVEFAIGPALTIDGKNLIFIENINVSYHRDSGYRSKSDKTYISEGGNFDEDYEIEPIFCTDTERMKYGSELIVGTNGFYGAKNGEDHIEQVVADRIAAHRNGVYKVLTLNLREGDAAYNISQPCIVIYGGDNYQCLSVSKNPAAGVTTVKLVKL